MNDTKLFSLCAATAAVGYDAPRLLYPWPVPIHNASRPHKHRKARRAARKQKKINRTHK